MTYLRVEVGRVHVMHQWSRRSRAEQRAQLKRLRQWRREL